MTLLCVYVSSTEEIGLEVIGNLHTQRETIELSRSRVGHYSRVTEFCQAAPQNSIANL